MRTPTARRGLYLALGLAAVPASSAWAQDAAANAAAPGQGLTELSDEELGGMRGRYTVGGDQVAWFGVTMVSSWQLENGQRLEGRLTLAVDAAAPDRPKLSFQPHVSITATDAPLPTDGSRAIDASGLANVDGLVQSVQVAGDGNRAHNLARVSLRNAAAGTAPEDPAATGDAPLAASASLAGMSASAALQDQNARVLLQIDGHGAVEQWIGRSGMGQTIQLASDGQAASNWMEVDIVRQPLAGGRAQLGQNVAQAIALGRGIALGY
ncbi:hypothetical protein [Pseudoxanthomonas sp.]|uniref:hypothetical protein n=1 Tax=Pseudoxanthomonas sp. TaxID=1871049 RepID=UPI00258EBF20|nr:hypothetical protein [Pseudoxanthomonas sp.]MCR6686109.1 hypothetical protein [Pseudoxanthomonas sp.]